jgi:hypothetical protein
MHHCCLSLLPCCSRVKSLEGLRILGCIAPQALRAGGQSDTQGLLPGLLHVLHLPRHPHRLLSCASMHILHLRSCRACSPADAKVVQFYTKLRQRQLQALSLDPAQFKTIY